MTKISNSLHNFADKPSEKGSVQRLVNRKKDNIKTKFREVWIGILTLKTRINDLNLEIV